jgi:hypothetical protein
MNDVEVAKLEAAIEAVQLPTEMRIFHIDGRRVFVIKDAEGNNQGYACYLYTEVNKRPYKFGVEFASDPVASLESGIKEFQKHLDELQ